MTGATGAAPLCLPPIPMSRAPSPPLPPGAVDTHFHIFEAGAALAHGRNYTPATASLNDWRAYAARAGIARGVIVQPSVYGFDNTVLLGALAAEPERLRGIAVIDPATPEEELARLHERGVRGVRFNSRNTAGLAFDAVAGLAARIAPLGWSLQFLPQPEELDQLPDLIPRLGATVVIDHLGFADLASPALAIARLRKALDAGRCFMKLSAPHRLSRDGTGADFAAVASALIDSHPGRLLWGSDWPHPALWDNVPDDAALIEDALALLGSDAIRRQVFIDTPNALFFAR